jgi:hypothetical protein
VIEKKGDYLLAVKENQKGLYEATEELFRRSSTREKNKLPQSEHTEKKENVHGRDESRCFWVLYLEKEVSFFPKEDWPEAHALIRIRSERKIRSLDSDALLHLQHKKISQRI